MNIFVSSLNFRARREDLIELFSPYGEVTSARIILNRETRRSRGYGFVEMSEEDGHKAITAINETEHMDRVITAAIANDRPSNPEEQPMAEAVGV